MTLCLVTLTDLWTRRAGLSASVELLVLCRLRLTCVAIQKAKRMIYWAYSHLALDASGNWDAAFVWRRTRRSYAKKTIGSAADLPPRYTTVLALWYQNVPDLITFIQSGCYWTLIWPELPLVPLKLRSLFDYYYQHTTSTTATTTTTNTTNTTNY